MDIYEVSVKIGNLVSESLTPELVSVLKADYSIGTIKIVSPAFDGLSITERVNKTVEIIQDGDPSILKQFDIAFVLVTPTENSEWIDYVELNKKAREDAEKAAAKEL